MSRPDQASSASSGRPLWLTIVLALIGLAIAYYSSGSENGGQTTSDTQQAKTDEELVLADVLPEEGSKTSGDEQKSTGDQKATPRETTPQKTAKPSHPKLELGQLREIGEKRYASTAGLLYVPGSREGHRLLHVLKHAKDDPGRPIHGVFEGTKEEILKTIDEAYLKAKSGGENVRKEVDRGRVVYTIDCGRTIGYVGGRVGKQRNNPKAKHLRLVLEDRTVITAFPLIP